MDAYLPKRGKVWIEDHAEDRNIKYPWQRGFVILLSVLGTSRV